MLSVVNLDADPGTVRFRFVADNGTQIGATRTLPIAGRGKISITAQDFFLDAGPAMVQGSVEIVGSGIRLAGSVAFGSATPGGFFTALPLAPARHLRLTFSQIASDTNFYTGLAILNPDSAPLRASIKVYDKSGNEIASKVEDLPAFGRVSKLLTDYFPELAGRQISGGYVIVEAIKNLAAFAVFGAKNLSRSRRFPRRFFSAWAAKSAPAAGRRSVFTPRITPSPVRRPGPTRAFSTNPLVGGLMSEVGIFGTASHAHVAHPVTHENRMRDRATWERARLARISSGFRNSMAFAGGTPAVPGYFRSRSEENLVSQDVSDTK